jgi:hypothetical protein
MRKPARRGARGVATPAIGPGGPLPRGVRRRRLTAAFSLVLLLVVARFMIPRVAAEAYPATGPGRLVAPGLIVGPEPTDTDLQQLTESTRIGGVVNVGSPSVAEQATATALHLAYLRIPVPTGGYPTWPQLRVLVSFMRFHTMRGDSVYLQDCDCNDGQAAPTAAMLLIMDGTSWRGSTTAGLGSMDRAQRQAIRQLDSALQPGRGPLPGNPYSAARRDTW